MVDKSTTTIVRSQYIYNSLMKFLENQRQK